jgi:hypothetical protein
MPTGKLERIANPPWEALFEMLDSADVPADFLTERRDGPAQRRKTLL